MESFQKPLTSKEEHLFLTLSQSGNIDARNHLVEHNMRLVAHIIKKYCNGERNTEDLISVGTIGLIKAINTYKIEKGNRLATYAARCIENELLMMLRQERKCSKEISLYEPMGTDKEGNEVSLMDIIRSHDLLTEEMIIKKQSYQKLYEIIDKMDENREKQILIMRYGLYGTKEYTQKEIAQLLGISRSYVSRIEKKVVETLRLLLQAT